MNKFLLPVLLSIAAASLCHAAEPYHLIKEIPIGGEGGWDYLSVDSSAQRLYLSHGTKVIVVDLAKDIVCGEITSTPGVHGLAPCPDLGLGVTSNGRENKASIVDLKTLQTLAKIETGENPDGMLYDPGQKEVYLFNGHGQSATVIDPKAAKVIATIPLGGKPEFAQCDSKAGLVFDNLEDKNEVVVIDARKHAIKNRWPISPGEEASGMALDGKNHRLFLGCGNNLMAMMDSKTGKILATVPIGDGVDANSFDPITKFAFASCGDGTTTIAREEGDKLTLVQVLKTERGARTMTIDPATHKIYLPSAKFDAPIKGQRRGRMVPDTLKIMVYGMDDHPAK